MYILAIRNDPLHRRIWEDGFSEALRKHGVNTTPSYRLFPDQLPDSAALERAVRDNNCDGILVSRRLPTETNTQYVEGYVASEPFTGFNPRTQKYFTYYKDVTHPGYTDSTRVARQAVEVWRVGENGAMVWSGTTATIDPNSLQEIQHDVVDLVVKELSQQMIIPSEHE